MKFNLLTFIFEIVNFFLLLWLLKKLLYKPVISLLMERKNLIESRMREAKEAEEKAKRLQEEYRHLLEKIEEKRKSEVARITKEVEEKRRQLEEQLEREMELERERFLSSLEAEKEKFLKEIKEDIIKLSVTFSSKLLEKLADKHIHQKLFDLSVELLKKIPEEERKKIVEEIKSRGAVQIESAYPVSNERVGSLKKLIKELFGVKANISVLTDSSLIAGVKLHLGSKLIDSSLKGQLGVLETLLRGKIEST